MTLLALVVILDENSKQKALFDCTLMVYLRINKITLTSPKHEVSVSRSGLPPHLRWGERNTTFFRMCSKVWLLRPKLISHFLFVFILLFLEVEFRFATLSAR